MDWLKKSWMFIKEALSLVVGKTPQWVGMWLFTLESIALTAVALACASRAYHFGKETDWTFKGMLQVLDTNWKGTLILAAALFYRTLHLILARMKPMYANWGEVTSGSPETVERPKATNQAEASA